MIHESWGQDSRNFLSDILGKYLKKIKKNV